LQGCNNILYSEVRPPVRRVETKLTTDQPSNNIITFLIEMTYSAEAVLHNDNDSTSRLGKAGAIQTGRGCGTPNE
jgi:hypothetical protein